MTCSIVLQFSISWAPRDTTLSYSSNIILRVCSTSVPSVSVISKSQTSLSFSKWSIHCSLSYVSLHNHSIGLSAIWISSSSGPSFSISSHSLTTLSEVLLCSTKYAARCSQSVTFSGNVRVLSSSESLATVMTSISSSSLYYWTLALL